jgi:curli biogenesis system outer membrane secretion channel CsgG
MKNLRWLAVLAVVCAACGGGGSKESTASAPAQGLKQQPYASLAQVMRALPFTAANILFDAQSNDPGAPAKEGAGADGSATARFSGIYKGWPLVEQSALALSETANLILIPGRLCENGKPVPLEREDFRKGIEGLVEAGKAAYAAAQTKNQDKVVEVTDKVTEACTACHMTYRDVPEGKMRCVAP